MGINSSPTSKPAKSLLTDILLDRLREETWKHMMKHEWNAVNAVRI